ncbi:MAG: hypothetical protein EOO60_02830 [Hymenobacter sp.]|nr:MAG: hypothetical protein EOO60_02830 [Hymenobacter sp.]
MSTVTEPTAKKVFAPDAELRSLELPALLAMMRSTSPHARTRAIIGLGAHLNQALAADALLAAIEDDTNIQASAMNIFSVAMVAAMVGLENGDTLFYQRLSNAINQLPSVQRQDVFDYLKLASKIDYAAKLTAA